MYNLQCIIYNEQFIIYSWNTTGMAIIVRQTLPLSMPGFHFGIIFITLKASLSSNGSTEVLTLILATLPSLFTMKDTTTVP